MRTKVIVFAASAVLTLACLAGATLHSTDDTHAVQKANQELYTALNALFTGNPEPLAKVWSHADDVTYLGPMGGILVGWEQIEASGKQQAGLKLGGHIEPTDIYINLGHDMAFVQCYERGQNFDQQGRPLPVSIRATNIFRKENGQWKLISHHTDLLPFLDRSTTEIK
jgi:ketosteroid isomerase-like protein